MSRTAQVLEITEYYQEKLQKETYNFTTKVVNDIIALDIMTPHVITIPLDATINEAVRLFVNEKVTALAVLDDNGKPFGVFSETDLARFERERPALVISPEDQRQLEEINEINDEDLHVESVSNPRIAEWVTPAILSVDKNANLEEVCNRLTKNHIHRVFVSEGDHLIGVISAMDIVAAMAALLDES
jgi:predicted transcriptional regulator